MPYRRVGSTDRLSTTVRDISGALVDPGDIVLRLRNPDRTVTAIDYNPGPIVRDSIGQFHYDVAGLSVLGDYAWLFKTTGVAQGMPENPRYFTLVDEFTPVLLTTAEAKSQINVTGTPDADLERYIDSASTEVETDVGQPVVPQIVTRQAAVLPDGRLLLPHAWVVPGSITAATQNGSAVNTAGWVLAAEGGLISGVTAPWGTVMVTYAVGFDPIPEPLREAAALHVQASYETQRGPASVPLAEDIPGSAASYTLILRARDKARRYRIPAVA